jgi:peptide/nickel transport system substrate-binding protein
VVRDSETRPRITRRTILKAAAGTAPALGAAAALGRAGLTAAQATPSSAGETPVNGGTLTYGSGKPTYNIINPLNTVGTSQNVLIEAMFLRLLYGRQWGDGLNPATNSQIDLAVAETMTEVAKDQAWEFTLRKNVFWHDGQPVTADDLIFGVWLSLNKDAKTSNETPVIALKGGDQLQTQGAGILKPPYDITIEGITKLDDYKVRIELTRPIPNYWIDWGVGYWPMPKHIFGQMPLANLFDEPYATMPIGNGPFKASKFVDGQYMEMVANDQFYLGRPHVDKYVVRFGDADTLAAAMEAQEIDGMGVPAGPAYDHLTSLDYIAGNAVPRPHPDGFVTNCERFADGPTLNKAIMHAIDVNTINSQLYHNTLRPSNDLFQHVNGFETPPAGFVNYDYSPDKAKAVLSGMNWDSSKQLSWLLFAPPGALENAMQAMLAAVGIQTKFDVQDPATVIDVLYNKADFDVTFENFGPSQYFEDLWKYIKCGDFYANGGFNDSHYCNQEVDALFQQVINETDAAKRKPLVDQLTLKLNDSPPQATLWRQSILYVWNKRVQGAYPYQYRLPVRPALERVWIKPS